MAVIVFFVSSSNTNNINMPNLTYDQITDENLFELIQKKNKPAFKEFFFRFYAVLLAYAQRFVVEDDAKEVVQNLMVNLWEKSQSIHIGSSVKNYLFRSIKNSCLTLITHNEMKRRIKYQLHEELRNHCDNPDFYIANELHTHIEQLLERLPESYREAFEMNRFHQKTYQQIADQLNVSSKTIDYRIQQALKILRKGLKDYLPFGSIII